MRKNSARKWLHFTLDLLPVIILPIFAIYEINHDSNTPVTVDVSYNKVVEFNQLVSSNNDTLPYDVNGVTISSSNDGSYNINGTSTAQIDFVVYWGYNTTTNNKYLVRDYENNSNISICFNGNLNNRNSILLGGQFNCTLTIASGITFNNYNYKGNLYDLTEMFGAGNEPTYSEFVSFYPNYYEYDTGTKQLLKNYRTETLSNTDVGSQMMYSLYKPVKDYFNFDNVFTFGQIYEWFELNMFGGNAPMPIYIVWNIIVYQFLMDLIFLIYGVFMYIIDFTEDTLSRFTGWSSRG